MAVKPVITYPDPILKQPCRPVDPAHEQELIQQICQDLLDTMRSFGHCLGIAAPQIGYTVRVAVVDVTGHKKTKCCHGELVLINPTVTQSHGTVTMREGCLSIPELTANVKRAESVQIQALDRDGNSLEIETDGFEARCLQHEIDHLDGLLFLDRVQSLKNDVFRRKRS